MPFDLEKCLQRILYSNESAVIAEELIDLLQLAVQPGFVRSNEYDDALERLYLQLDHCRASRRGYVEKRRELVTAE